jgi:hypothetical protein
LRETQAGWASCCSLQAARHRQAGQLRTRPNQTRDDEGFAIVERVAQMLTQRTRTRSRGALHATQKPARESRPCSCCMLHSKRVPCTANRATPRARPAVLRARPSLVRIVTIAHADHLCLCSRGRGSGTVEHPAGTRQRLSLASRRSCGPVACCPVGACVCAVRRAEADDRGRAPAGQLGKLSALMQDSRSTPDSLSGE